MSRNTKESIKHAAIAFAIYLATYSAVLIAVLGILSAIGGTEELDFATLVTTVFSSFPATFAGNLLPSGIGYLVAKCYIDNKVPEEYDISARFYTLCAFIALEVIGILFSGNITNASSIALITFFIYKAVNIYTLHTAFSMARAKGESPEKYAVAPISYDDIVDMAKMQESDLKSSLKALKKKGVINKYQMALILHFGMVRLRDLRKKELDRQTEGEGIPTE